jgi:serine O-acetyltransferase
VRFLVATINRWLSAAPRTLRRFRDDVEAVLRNDPAARGALEVVLTYPGLHALWIHRVAHDLWRSDAKFAARLLSHAARFLTGVEIHPGARIAHGVFIDHGMGVVIGETTRIGAGCLIYKGAVLGGTTGNRGCRHPRLGRGVIVGSNACVLGPIEVGDHARVGSGSVVVRPVPAGATVVGVPGRVIAKRKGSVRVKAVLDHADLPDPLSELVLRLTEENDALSRRIDALERALDCDLGRQRVEDGQSPLKRELVTAR